MEKWTIDNQDNYPDEYAICDDMGSLICTIPREDQYREKDAHLIAAAPELLEALKSLASSYETCLKSKTSAAVWQEVAEANLKYILAAIQRAQP